MLLDKYAIDYALLENRGPLHVLLEASGEWRQVYGDEVAVLLRAWGRTERVTGREFTPTRIYFIRSLRDRGWLTPSGLCRFRFGFLSGLAATRRSHHVGGGANDLFGVMAGRNHSVRPQSLRFQVVYPIHGDDNVESSTVSMNRFPRRYQNVHCRSSIGHPNISESTKRDKLGL